jgi:uncharacterized protein YcfL
MHHPFFAVLPVDVSINKVVSASAVPRLMNHHRNFLFCLTLAAAFLSGCATDRGNDGQVETTKYTIESTGMFVFLNQSWQASVKCTGLQERILPDGRLEVVANVRNLETRNIEVQVNCVFKDEQGLSTENETPSTKLTIPAGTTQAVQFSSANNQARKYTIHVRDIR